VAALAPSISTSATDPLFSSVSLLLPLNGANGSTTFTDFSPTPATLTRYGNAQISTAQSKFGGASALFDGSGGYIQSSISNGLSLSSGDFTIEFWARFLTGGEENQVLFQLGTTGDLYSGLMQLNNGVKVFLGSNGSSWDIAENMPVGPKVDNTWVRYALTRSGSTFRAFADGVQQSTWTSNASIHQSSNGITIGKGQFAFVNRNLNAHIDDFRVTKGVARYTANFTPTGPHPLVGLPDPLFASVSLLLPLNGANNSTTFTDASVNSLVATVAGNAKISTAQSKYGGASASFDGSGDYIQFTDSNSVLDLPGDFTLEFWLYRTNASNKHAFVQIGNLVLYADAGDGTLRVWDGGSGPLSGGSISTATWQHIAMTRAGTVARLFIDGSVVNTNNAFITAISTTQAYIGAENANSNWLEGFIDDLRVTKGIARYQSAFTPTGPHSTQGPSTVDPLFASTSLLLPLNGSFEDSSSSNLSSSIVGSGVSFSADIRRFGTGSVYFNNAGYVSFGQQNALLFDGDFTIECWIRLDDLNQNHTIGSSSNASNTQIFRYGYGGNNLVTCYINDQFVVESANAGTQAQVWQHLALCRSGSNTRFFADGVQVGATYTSNFGSFRMDVIGATIWSGGIIQYMKGHIDDLRLTKAARYTANFTPTGPHPLS
jgi:hypothetical protein